MFYGSDYLNHVEKTCRDLSSADNLWEEFNRLNDTSLELRFAVGSFGCGLRLSVAGEQIELSVSGQSADSQRFLRNVLIGKFKMVRGPDERHLLEKYEMASNNDKPYIKIVEWIHTLRQLGDSVHAIMGEREIPLEYINIYWWDYRTNFGDAIGPWLAKQITGRQPINGRGALLSPPPIATVGSVVGMVEQDQTLIWGSGLLSELSDESVERLRMLRGISVHAVRGKLTQAELISKLGWKVPDIYGDPALLMPRYMPLGDNYPSRDITVVPHYYHAAHFESVQHEDIQVVNVDLGMETVIQKIAASRACISSSLHGIVIAQAYGVPWVWLRVEDHALGGGTFKFEDFFTTLDRSAVREHAVHIDDIRSDDLSALADSAALPDLKISLDDLLGCFPY